MLTLSTRPKVATRAGGREKRRDPNLATAYDRPMRAVIQHEFGGPEVLAIEQVRCPSRSRPRSRWGPRRGRQPGRREARMGRGVSRCWASRRFRSAGTSPASSARSAPVLPASRSATKSSGCRGSRAGGRLRRVRRRRRRGTSPQTAPRSPTRRRRALPLAALTAWQVLVDTIRVQDGRRPADPRRRRRGRPPRGADRQGARRQRDRHGAGRAGGEAAELGLARVIDYKTSISRRRVADSTR